MRRPKRYPYLKTMILIIAMCGLWAYAVATTVTTITRSHHAGNPPALP